MATTIALGIDARSAQAGASDFAAAGERALAAAKAAAAEVSAMNGAMADTQPAAAEAQASLDQFSTSATANAHAQADLGSATSNTSDALDELKSDLAGMKERVDVLGESEKAAAEAAKEHAEALDTAKEKANEFRRTLLELVGVVGALEAIHRSVEILKDFEGGLIETGLKTHITGEALEDLGHRIEELSTRIPVSSEKLLELASNAGQLGIRGTDNVLRFVETMARLESVTDLAGTAGATSLVRLVNVSGEAKNAIEGTANSILALSNNTAATAAQIVESATHIANSTALYHTTSIEAAALGAAVAELGGRAGLGASAIGESISKIGEAVKEGDDELKAFSEIAGLTSTEFAEAFSKNAPDALVVFLQGLGRLIQGGGDAEAALKRVGLGSENFTRVLGPLALRATDVAGALDLARKAAEEHNLVTEESSTRFDSLSGKLTLLGNTYDKIVTSYAKSTGALSAIVEAGAGAIAIIGGVATREQEASTAANVLATAIEAATVAAIAFQTVKLVAFLEDSARAAGSMAQGVQALTVAMEANPVAAWAGLIGAAAVALTILIPVLSHGSDETKEFAHQVDAMNSALAQVPEIQGRVNRALSTGDLKEGSAALQDLARDATVYKNALLGAIEIDPAKATAGVDALKKFVPGIDIGALELKLIDELREAYRKASETVGKDAAYEQTVKSPLLVSFDKEAALKELQKTLSNLGQTEAAAKVNVTLDPDVRIETFLQNLQLKSLPAKDSLALLEAGIKQLTAESAKLNPDNQVGPFRTTDLEKQHEGLDLIQIALYDIGQEIEAGEKRKLADVITDDAVKNLQFEISLLGQDKDERSIAIALRAKENELIKTGADNIAGRLQKYEDELRLRTTLYRLEAEADAAKKKGDAGHDAIDAEILGLTRATNALQEHGAQLELDTELQKNFDTAKRAGIALTNAEVLIITALVGAHRVEKEAIDAADESAKEYLRTSSQIVTAQNKASDNLETLISNKEKETKYIGLDNASRERAIFLRKAEDDAIAAGRGPEYIAEQLERAKKAYEDFDKATNIKHTADTIGEAFANLGEVGAENFHKLGDAARQLGQTIVHELYDQLVGKQIAKFVSGLASNLLGGTGLFGSAQGNAFDQGNVIPYAKGGLPDFVDQPTYFPLAGGKTGVAGEAGPEAILKLQRDSSGDLGVKSVGGGAIQPHVTNNYTTHHHTWNIRGVSDGNGMKKSTRQITRTFAQATRGRG